MRTCRTCFNEATTPSGFCRQCTELSARINRMHRQNEGKSHYVPHVHRLHGPTNGRVNPGQRSS